MTSFDADHVGQPVYSSKMAAPMNRRLSSLFLLLCISSVQIIGESNVQNDGRSFEEVDELTLDAVSQTQEHVLAFFRK